MGSLDRGISYRVVYSVSVGDDLRRVVDPLAGQTFAFTPIQLAGFTVTQGQALATDPTTGELYAVITVSGQNTRRLVVVDPATGIATDRGDLLDKFANLAFDNSGTLYGVTGDGSTISETVFTIDKQTAQTTLLLTLGNGSGGESIGFDPAGGVLYHASGKGTFNDPVNGTILETIDLATLAITPVTLSGASPSGLQCLTRLDSDTFLSMDQNGAVYSVTTSGTVSLIVTMDHVAKDLAFSPGPSFFESYGAGCPGTAGFVPTLTGLGMPNPGDTVSITIGAGLGGAPGVLLFGLGTAGVSVVPTCSAEIAPIVPGLSAHLTLSGVGAGAGSISLSGTIPGTLGTGDVFMQAFLADPGAGGGISATNPLHLHIQ